MSRLTPSYVHTFRNPTFVNPRTGKVMPNDTGWQDRHMEAILAPNSKERALVAMLTGWAQYADDHRIRYDAKVGDDGVMGEEWEAIGRAIHGLLNGETGRLDCGTLSAFIYDSLSFEGFKS